jgi:hypothetical protein
MFSKSLILLNGGQITSLMWSPLEYAAPNDCQIRISSGGETKKIKVLDSEPNQSLAKSPNAQYAGIYATSLEHFSIADFRLGDLRSEMWDVRFRISNFGLRILD